MDNYRTMVLEVVEELKKKLILWRKKNYGSIPDFKSLSEAQTVYNKF